MNKSAASSHQHSQPKHLGSPRKSTRSHVMAGAVALLLLLPPFAYAQQNDGRPASQREGVITVTPQIGMYIPVSSLVADNSVRLRPVAAIALGNRVALPLNDRLTIEGALTWSPNLIAQSDVRETVDFKGGAWFGSARVRARAGSLPDGEAIASITTGIGLVHRYGDVWSGMRGTTDAAVVIGGGLRYVELDSRVTFTLDFEGFFTRTGYTDNSGRFYGGRLQKDVIVSFGAAIDLSSKQRN